MLYVFITIAALFGSLAGWAKLSERKEQQQRRPVPATRTARAAFKPLAAIARRRR